jgi:DNA replication protein DnaC
MTAASPERDDRAVAQGPVRVRMEPPDPEPRECPEHGTYMAKGLRWPVSGRVIWLSCPACEEAKAAAERERAAAAEAKKRAEYAEMRLGQAAIPPRFLDRDFASYRADSDSQRAALTISRDFVEHWPENLRRGSGLVFSGLPGTGKSHLAASILLALAQEWDVTYTTCMRMIRAVRNTWRRDSEESEVHLMRYLGEDLHLLVIDEVGLQYGTDGEQTIVTEVLDRRYAGMRPTIILTNQNRDGLKGYLGDRAYDRLTETSRWVKFDWPSYRPTARAERRP